METGIVVSLTFDEASKVVETHGNESDTHTVQLHTGAMSSVLTCHPARTRRCTYILRFVRRVIGVWIRLGLRIALARCGAVIPYWMQIVVINQICLQFFHI